MSNKRFPTFRYFYENEAGNADQADKLTNARLIYGNTFDGTSDCDGVIDSQYGGVGNGFTKFTGPTTTEKSFSLPNASATILTSASTVTAAQGGTGRSSYSIGDLLSANTPSTLGIISSQPAGKVLKSKGINTIPAFEKVDLQNDIDGILPIINGGTNTNIPLTNDRLMLSSNDSIIEAPQLTNGQIMIGADIGAPFPSTITPGAGIAVINDPNEITIQLDPPLNNVDNTSDQQKPISTATQQALDTKQDVLVNEINIKSVSNQSLLGSGNIVLDKSDVQLSNVDNTSDNDKPVSTATQTSLNLKPDIPVTPTQGGTGHTAYTTGDILCSNTSTTLTKISTPSGSKILFSTGTATLPTWSSVSLTSGAISGITPITKGGTNSNTALTNNKIMVSNAGSITESSALSDGQLLIGSTGAAPVVSSIAPGTGITVTNSPGAISIAANPVDLTSTQATGILPFSKGGTGNSSYTRGDILVADTSSTLAKLQPATANRALCSNGAGNTPTYQDVVLTTHTTGTLPINRGGTNNTTTLNNNRVMLSSSGSISESGQLTNGQLIIGSSAGPPLPANITGSNGVVVTNGTNSIDLSYFGTVLISENNPNQTINTSAVITGLSIAVPPGTWIITASISASAQGYGNITMRYDGTSQANTLRHFDAAWLNSTTNHATTFLTTTVVDVYAATLQPGMTIRECSLIALKIN